MPKPDESVERVLGRFDSGPLNLRHVGYFLVVCEEMHFGRASRRLRVAQPALSQQIKRLEAFVGVSLFDRNRRGIAFTAAGQVFRDYALSLAKQVDEAKRASQRAQLGETGKLTVGLIPSGNNSFVLERVARYRKAHADVEVVVESMVTTRQVDAVASGRIDVGFLRLPVRHHEIDVRKIHSESMIVALPRKHRLAKAARIRLADVAKEELIIFPREIAPSYFDYIVSLFRLAGHELKIRHQIEHSPIILALIAHGFGFTLVPASQQAYGHDDVVFKPLEETTPFIEMGMIARADNRSPLLVSLLEMFPAID